MECERGTEMDQSNEDSPCFPESNNIPAWCRDEKYQRYWSHYDQLQQWFCQYSTKCEEKKAESARRSDPLFQQYATSQAWKSSYWMHYHYYNMALWQQRCQELSQRQYHTAIDLYQRRMHDDRYAMPPPRSNFVPNSRQQRQFHNSYSSTSSECLTDRKRSKRQVSSKHMQTRRATKDHVTDIVLDLDPSVLKEEEEVIECHMEITDEMLEFFAQSARHRQERDAQKTEDEKNENTDKYIDITKAHSGAAQATTEAPKERPGSKRTQEMKVLYGKGAAMIHGMETAMQLTFDRYVDLNQPKLWPHLPLNIKFD